MKTAAWQLLTLAPIELAPEAVGLAAGKTQPFEGFTLGKPAQLFPRGRGRTVDGRPVRCEEEDFRLLLGDLSTRKNPVTATYEHERDPLKGSKAAGECASSAFSAKDDGFWADGPHWSDEALGEIRSGTRRWISPAFYGVEDEEGAYRPRVLRDYTLCSVPNLDGMQPVTATAHRGGPGPGGLHAPASGGSTPPPGTIPQNHSPGEASRKEEPMKLPLTMKALGLADGTSQEDVDSTVAKVVQERDELRQKLTAARQDVKALVKEEMAAEREAIRTEVKAELAAESAKNARETRVAALLQRAEKDGKLVADNRERLTKWAAADPDSFEANLPDLKVVAAVEPFLSGHAADPAEGDSAAIDAKARELQKQAMAAGKPMTYTEAAIAAAAKKVA